MGGADPHAGDRREPLSPDSAVPLRGFQVRISPSDPWPRRATNRPRQAIDREAPRLHLKGSPRTPAFKAADSDRPGKAAPTARPGIIAAGAHHGLEEGDNGPGPRRCRTASASTSSSSTAARTRARTPNAGEFIGRRRATLDKPTALRRGKTSSPSGGARGDAEVWPSEVGGDRSPRSTPPRAPAR